MTAAGSAAMAAVGRGRHRAELERLGAAATAGLLEEVIAECEALLAAEAGHPAALYGLGLAAIAKREWTVALDTLTRAQAADPGECVYAEALAVLHALAGDLAGAAYYAKLSAALGLDEEVLALLPAALPPFALALQIIRENPHRAEAERLAASGRDLQAIDRYEAHLAVFPHDVEAIRGLCQALLRQERPGRAAALLAGLRQAGRAGAAELGLLGEAFAGLGEAAAAEGCHLAALALAPDDAVIACARLRDAVFHPGRTAAELAALCRAWGAELGKAELGKAELAGDGSAPAEHDAAKDRPGDDRPVGIGYLLSACRDPRDLEVLAAVTRAVRTPAIRRTFYGLGAATDPGNGRFAGGWDEWRDMRDVDPLTLAAMVQGDEIDLLVDTGGHAAPVHLLALAGRPAPVQVSWLGNPVTLGLGPIDVELSGDPDTSNPDGRDGVSQVRAAPHGLYCYAVPAPPSGDRGDAWAGGSGMVTFGADVALAQLHEDLVACWAAILTELPNAVLALRDRNFALDGVIDRLAARFADAGIAGRIEVVRADPAGFWPQVDIALAPFVAAAPHDAAAALAAGVPVVALAGTDGHRRQAATLLRHAGLPELTAADEAGYRAAALGLARSTAAHAAAAAAVAHAVASSPVFDPPRFAAALDEVLIDLVREPK